MITDSQKVISYKTEVACRDNNYFITISILNCSQFSRKRLKIKVS